MKEKVILTIPVTVRFHFFSSSKFPSFNSAFYLSLWSKKSSSAARSRFVLLFSVCLVVTWSPFLEELKFFREPTSQGTDSSFVLILWSGY